MTTAWFGKASWDFAPRNRVELIDGRHQQFPGGEELLVEGGGAGRGGATVQGGRGPPVHLGPVQSPLLWQLLGSASQGVGTGGLPVQGSERHGGAGCQPWDPAELGQATDEAAE
ncbi:hypothetical protein ACFVID_35035 [Streptomyces sp. NPDC127132]|uniref:hypothetical protein n=1 Tax=Streptomyces sp. NPDC127132 TaxID=3345374 RepID=UPI00364114EC